MMVRLGLITAYHNKPAPEVKRVPKLFDTMFIFQRVGTKQEIPFTTKLALLLWTILGLVIVSFFAFSVLIIAVVVGAIFFVVNLFQKKTAPNSIPKSPSSFQTRTYSPPRNIKDDDIIDI